MKGINIKLVWGISMIVVYLGMSFLLIFTNLFEGNMSFTTRVICGVLFFGYTLFRGYRLIKYGK